jgi:hypothetical protein
MPSYDRALANAMSQTTVPNFAGPSSGDLQQAGADIAALKWVNENRVFLNDLRWRHRGSTYTDEQLALIAVGGQPAVSLYNELNEMKQEELFRDVYRSLQGREPSHDEYSWLKRTYSSPEEYRVQVDVERQVGELGPQYKELFRDYLKRQLTDDELRTIFRGGEGAGNLRNLYEEATRRKQGRLGVKAASSFAKPTEVGPATGLPGR